MHLRQQSLNGRMALYKYFDKNKRELGTLSNNVLTCPGNDYFWVGDETAIENVEDTVESAVKVSGNTITVADDAVTTIYSTDGREVYHGTDNCVVVAKGMYIVTVQHNGATTTRKLFIK